MFYNVRFKNNHFKALLHRHDIADGKIFDCRQLSKILNDIPLCISEIDMEKNRISLSLIDLVSKNSERIKNMSYEKTYNGYIIAQAKNDYIALIKGLWVVGRLETEKKYSLGDEVEVRPVSVNDNLILTDN